MKTNSLSDSLLGSSSFTESSSSTGSASSVATAVVASDTVTRSRSNSQDGVSSSTPIVSGGSAPVIASSSLSTTAPRRKSCCGRFWSWIVPSRRTLIYGAVAAAVLATAAGTVYHFCSSDNRDSRCPTAVANAYDSVATIASGFIHSAAGQVANVTSTVFNATVVPVVNATTSVMSSAAEAVAHVTSTVFNGTAKVGNATVV